MVKCNYMNISDDEVTYCKDYLRSIIRDGYNIYLQEKHLRDFHTFTTHFYLNMKYQGFYLFDVDFYDLKVDGRRKIVHTAFDVWRNYKVEAGLMVK